VYEVLGLLLGKALHEGILVSPRFAHFVLRKLRGRANAADDLASYDAELYRQLVGVKRLAAARLAELERERQERQEDLRAAEAQVQAQGSGGGAGPAASSPLPPPPTPTPDPVAALGLVFAVSEASGAETPLLPRGASLAVTSRSAALFVRLVAEHRLNAQIARQVRAFLRGFRRLVPLAWLRMFSEGELQLLLGGRPGIDVADWRRCTAYGGGFAAGDAYVGLFWQVVADFSPEDQALLLAFVTSVPRPPLLGFAALSPPFTVRRMEVSERAGHAAGSLPQSHTCFCMLDLPVYASRGELRDKLLMAIRSGSGFELT